MTDFAAENVVSCTLSYKLQGTVLSHSFLPISAAGDTTSGGQELNACVEHAASGVSGVAAEKANSSCLAPVGRMGKSLDSGRISNNGAYVKPGIVASTLAERLTLLRKSTLLGTLPEDVQMRIAGFAHDRVFRDGKTIFRKGDPGSSMMFLIRGRVRICVSSPDGREITFGIIERGEVFGEWSLVDGQHRSADAMAFGDAHLLIIERRAFIPFLESNPPTAIQLLSLLCERARNASEFAENVALYEVPIRLARLFLELARSYGKRAPEGLRIDLKLSQRNLGNLVAGSRETINKLLRQWQREGLLDMVDSTLIIRELQAFEVLAKT